jgi:uncharacterized RDD family membrane protein YckC
MSRRILRQVSFSTPESVELEFVLAGIGNRALALTIDYTLMWLAQVLFILLFVIFTQGLTGVLDQAGGNFSQAPVWLWAIFLLVTFAIFTGYFAFFETLWQGQTPGKRVAKIRVIRDNGKPVGLAQTTLRSLLRSVDDFFFIGVFFIVFTKQEKRIGDMVAGTIVIQESSANRRENLIVSPAARELAAKLPQITNLSQVSPDDFAVVSSYLKRRPLMDMTARSDLSLKLARQLRTIIELETIPAGTTSDQFLEAVYIAYQQQVSESGESFSD